MDVQSQNKALRNRLLEIVQEVAEFVLFILKCVWLIGKATVALIIPTPLKPVRGEIVLITGAASGIGRELALRYASERATVVCWDINQTENLKTVNEIARLGYPKGFAYVCDVANREQVMEVAKKVQNDIGDVTILINNAGIMPHRPFLEHSSEEIKRIMNVNTMAHFWTLEAFLPAMIKNNHGHIVAISSGASLLGLRNLTPYCASKFAVRGMMEALSQDLRVDPKCQIKLTQIYPFAVKTGLYNAKDVHLKYPRLTPILKPKYTAEYIMNAQRSDIFETTVPGYLLTLACFRKLLPTKVIEAVLDSFGGYIESDVKRKI